jgi:dipeptidyl aminopeptidase/acylaminoacyl peptidase
MDSVAVVAAIPVERCVVGRDLTEPRLSFDGSAMVYALSASGATVLIWHPLDGSPERQLTSYPSPRAGRGFGGGCWCWTAGGDGVVYVATDGNLWLQPLPGGAVRKLTDHGPDRSASSPCAAPDGGHLVFVLDQAEVWSVSLVDLAARRIDEAAADFCLDPCVQPGGIVRWQAWSVPDMPWDAAQIHSATLDGKPLPPMVPCGSAQQPRALADGRLAYLRDDTGWLNVWVDEAPVIAEPFEHAGPTWGAGQCSFVGSPDGRELAFTRNEGGFGRLCVVDLASRQVRDVARGVHGQLSWHGSRLAALRSGARTPTQVVVYDTDTWSRTVVAIGPLSGWEDESLAEPELVEVAAGDGAHIAARLYLADAPTTRLLCWLHGGPTDQWQVTFMPRIAYWRSRGWNVLVPDHRGSTGHGRAYQQALRERWGEVDVGDVLAVLSHARAQGWAAADTTVLIGGSAGGFTALSVIATDPEAVAAGVVAYPVTDLFDLSERSHRFERHYMHTLVGALPEAEARFRSRSPVSFAHKLARRPLLIMHGDSDPVVPVEHSTVLAERINAAGGDAQLTVYAGEGHGFRQPVNQLDEYARIEAFLARHVPQGSVR